jgi:hypothetical protein
MNFREWIINEELWGQGTGERWNIDTMRPRTVKFPIYKNPEPRELQDILEMPMDSRNARGLLMASGDVYIWPGAYATHQQVEMEKGLRNYAVAFYVYPFEVAQGFDELVKSHYGRIYDYERTTGRDIDSWKEDPRILHMLGEPDALEKAG